MVDGVEGASVDTPVGTRVGTPSEIGETGGTAAWISDHHHEPVTKYCFFRDVSRNPSSPESLYWVLFIRTVELTSHSPCPLCLI